MFNPIFGCHSPFISDLSGNRCPRRRIVRRWHLFALLVGHVHAWCQGWFNRSQEIQAMWVNQIGILVFKKLVAWVQQNCLSLWSFLGDSLASGRSPRARRSCGAASGMATIAASSWACAARSDRSVKPPVSAVTLKGHQRISS